MPANRIMMLANLKFVSINHIWVAGPTRSFKDDAVHHIEEQLSFINMLIIILIEHDKRQTSAALGIGSNSRELLSQVNLKC
jgi:hypothetical protein